MLICLLCASVAGAQTVYQNVQKDVASAWTDNMIPRSDGTTRVLQTSVLSIADTTGALSGFTSGNGITFHGGGTLTGASGALTLTQAAGLSATFDVTSGTDLVIYYNLGGVKKAGLSLSGGNTYYDSAGNALFRTGAISGSGAGTLALTLDSSQNATFAGRFGFGTTSGTAAFRGSGTTIETVRGDNGAYADLRALNITTTGGGTVSAPVTAIGTTSTDSFLLTSNTSATSGVPVQMAGRIRFRGHAWDGAASQTVDFFIENLPTSAATPTGTLKFGYSLNGAAATYPMTLTSAGAVTYLAGGSIGWSGRASLLSPGDAVLQLGDQNRNAGVTINYASANTFKFRNFADTADAALTAGALTLSSGVTFSPYNGQTGTTYTLVAADTAVTFNNASGVTVTLGTATNGRTVILRNIAAGAIVSASSNVVPLAGGAAGTAIIAATAGKWAMLQGDGTNWQIIAGNP